MHSLARTLIEAATADTLVIHMADRSTDFLTAIHVGRGYPVVTHTPPRKELLTLIEQHDRVFMLGHGGPGGLFSHSYLIDDYFGEALAKKKDGLYIWCNADAYAKRNKLSGLVSGMFISEVGEAQIFGIEATQREVNASNALFSKTVRACLDAGQPPSAVKQGYTHATCKVTQFNNERLYVFNQGTPSPALHPSSLAHSNWRADRGYRDEFDDFSAGEREAWLAQQQAKAKTKTGGNRRTRDYWPGVPAWPEFGNRPDDDFEGDF